MEINPGDIADIKAATSNAASSAGAAMEMVKIMNADILEIKNEIKDTKQILKGNGDPTKGILWQVAKVKDFQKNCPALKNSEQIAETLSTVKKLLTLKKGEDMVTSEKYPNIIINTQDDPASTIFGWTLKILKNKTVRNVIITILLSIFGLGGVFTWLHTEFENSIEKLEKKIYNTQRGR